jgi:putative transcriptional regulator
LALGNGADLGAGSLLAATAKSHDPDFAGSVVLLIHYDGQSAIGLMLNKPTSIPISEVLPEVKSKAVTVYAGGPVAIGVRALVRTQAPPFFAVVTQKAELLKLLSSSATFRVYAGYVGWTRPQLQSEVSRGLWKVLPPTPSTLWPRLTQSRPIR